MCAAQAGEPTTSPMVPPIVVRVRLSETLVEHSLQLAVTNAACDSALSPGQCLGWLATLPEQAAPRFTTISLLKWAQTIPEIDTVLYRVVSKDTEVQRWQVLRSLAIQGRQTIANLTKDAAQSTHTTPESILNLNSSLGIARVEIVHRILISGDRLMVDHMSIDRTEANALANKRIDTVPAQELVDMTDSLRANYEKSMQILGESAAVAIAKSKLNPLK